MREGESGWYYVGGGQLRYKDGERWTDEYQDVDKGPGGPPRHSAPVGPGVGADCAVVPLGAAVSADTGQRRRRALAPKLVGVGLVALALTTLTWPMAVRLFGG